MLHEPLGSAIQERVAFALFANGGQFAMARYHDRFIGQGHQRIVQRTHNLLHVAAGEIGAADAAGEQRVSGDQLLLGSEVETDAALGVAGGGHHIGFQISHADYITRG